MTRLPSETSLIDAILRYLRAQGCFVWRNNSGATAYHARGRRSRFVRYGLPGSSDVIGVMPGGRAIFLEAKRRPNTLTSRQGEFLNRMRELGAVAEVIYDVRDLERLFLNDVLRKS